MSEERKSQSRRPDFPVVGIGASAGGLEAFTQLLSSLATDTGMAFVLVQHLDPHHESALTQILSRATSLPVIEIADNQPVEPNHVYVIPRDTSLRIAGGILKLEPRKGGAPHRPIDAFFESLAQDRHERAIGVVLSGTATDGTLGLEAIKAEGGITFAQDESAKHGSMPRSAIASGVVDLVLSPPDIAQELGRIAGHPFLSIPFEPRPETNAEDRGEIDRAQATAHEDDDTALPSGGGPNESGTLRGDEKGQIALEDGGLSGEAAENGYKRILLLLRNHSGVDFSLYKSTTIQRRITRRLVLSKRQTLEDYVGSLKGNSKELDALYSDVLISVTSFFRDPEAFDSLQREVLSTLLEQGDGPVRCWVLGCSTGQEAYSIAMAFVEMAERAPRTRGLQVFATDLNDALLNKARHGLYAKSLAEDISPERLRRFFIEEDGGYRISKSLREMVVFAKQNLIADPPFSRMDLISCRNLLIYFEPSLQRKAIPTFHYALRPGGFLMLGASESVGNFTELFEPVDKKHKIYLKKAGPTPAFHLPLEKAHGDPRNAFDAQRSRTPTRIGLAHAEGLRGELSAQREADRLVSTEFAPPGVLIDDRNQVLQFRGATAPYLQPPAGKASFDVLKMAREGLMIPLRAAIKEADTENKRARRENIRIQRNEDGLEARTVDVEVIPLKNLPERSFLVLFMEPERPRQRLTRQTPTRSTLSKEEEANRVDELEKDLSETSAYLQAVQEQQEAVNEELQASNEELQSANEELQSVNEELETSKEELESANEELSTVNDEMNTRNAELSRLNNDLINLQTSTKLAIILLGRDLAIRRFSPQAQKQFDLVATDLGRPIGRIRHDFVLTPHAEEEARASGQRSDREPAGLRERAVDIESMATEAIESLREQDCEVRDKSSHWYRLRVRPYITLDNKVDGAVLLLVDIDEMKRAEQLISAGREYAENTIATLRDPLLVLDEDMRVESVNRSFYRTFHVTPKETIGKRLHEIGNGQWDIPGLRVLLDEVMGTRNTVENYLVQHEFEDVGERSMLLNARRIVDPHRKSNRILLAIEDITERRRLEEFSNRELAAGQCLQYISGRMIAQDDGDSLYGEILDAAMTIMDSDMASMQTVDEREDALRLLASRGFGPEFGKTFELNRSDARTSCSVALRLGKRVIVPDVEACDFIVGTPRLEDYRRTGIRAVQSTPLLSRRGKVLGIISTYWREPHSPPENALRSLDILARLTSDLVERMHAQDALRESEERFRTLADNMAQFAWAADARGSIYWYNRRWFDYTGTTLEEMQREGWKRVIHPDHLNQVIERMHHSWDTGEPWEDIFRLRGRDGEYRWYLSRALPIHDEGGDVIRWFGTNTDVTEQRAMADRIERQAELLAGESRRKDEFLAMLSHELRNPVAPIRSAVHLLKLHKHGSEDAIERQAREIIERQTANLSRIVDDLMEASRAVSGRIRLSQQTVDLNQIVVDAVETTRPLLDERRHELVISPCSDPVWVNVDATRMEEVLVNLLNNAAKYTPDGGRIEVDCEQVPERNVVKVRVRDNGVGIEPELLQDGRIFDLFTQADRSLARSSGGLGIGLSLVHRLVELHGGTIEAKSPPAGSDTGSEFIVTLSLISPPVSVRHSAQTDDAAPGAGDGVRVLVVDDNIDQATMVASALRYQGYSVQTAYNGPDGVKLAHQGKPDILLLDIGLPGMDGYEIARRLRADPTPELQRLRIIAITGYGRESDIAKSREAGFDAHLTKPFDLEDLVKLMVVWTQSTTADNPTD